MNRGQAAWILTAAQQRKLDEAAVRAGTPSVQLMESAGASAADWILSHTSLKKLVILAGPGGNGGDAFVVARRLLQAGVQVSVMARNDLGTCLPLVQKMGHAYRYAGGAFLSADTFPQAVRGSDGVVDGWFGSGLSRPLVGQDAEVVSAINDTADRIISLDVPSGLASDTGAPIGPSIRAHVSLAMAFMKPCHVLYPSAEHCGSVHVVEVDYPASEIAALDPTAVILSRSEVGKRLPDRAPAGHKGTFGRVLVVAGSPGMTGAAILCGRAALRAGAGLVEMAIPASIAPVIQTAIPEATTVVLDEADGDLDVEKSWEALQPAIERADAMAIGPGLSRERGALELVRAVVRTAAVPIVLDADAVYALIGHEDLFSTRARAWLLTPHLGEFRALTGLSSESIERDPFGVVQRYARAHDCHLLLKGRPTVIGRPDGSLVVNPTGNTGLATGGSGDVLTGLITGLAAGGVSIDDAAIGGAYTHGWAADRWTETYAERSLTPSDVLNDIPEMLKEIEREVD